MDKDFEEWLKEDDLFEYYSANLEQQADIYEEYQREKEYFEPKHIDEWIEWLCNNPELAEKHYPLLTQALKERIQKSPSFVAANMIQSLPKQFSIWKTEINNLSGKYKEKRIKEQIALLNGVLNEWKYLTEIEQEAIESVYPILSEQLEYWKNEMHLRIKALFQFIEYLHSNIDTFNQYNSLIEELEQLDKERKKLKPEQNYKDKQKRDNLQVEHESKFKVLQDNTANLIKAKARELNVCNFKKLGIYSFNGIETEIRQLKENFRNEDLAEIFKHKSQYIEFRCNTHATFLSLQHFFSDLDEIAKSLFDYFKDTEQNEFKAFENKAIPVNSITELIKGFQQGLTKFTLRDKVFFNPSQSQQPQNETSPPQQSQFSVLEWATIFYYADETKLLAESKATKNRWEQFMKKHNINTTSNTFKKNYYDAKKRINEKNNFPIDKLNSIIQFTKENYSQAVTKIENDILFLKSEQTEH